MQQKIIGFSGRKQSGKNTCANVIFGWEMISLGITRNFSISDSGELVGDSDNLQTGAPLYRIDFADVHNLSESFQSNL